MRRELQSLCAKGRRDDLECAPLTGCGTQHPLRALDGTRVLLAAAPTTPPCFRRWRRSSSLRFAHHQRKEYYKFRVWSDRVCGAQRSAAMKAPVGLLSGRAVCVSRWRGFAPTSSAGRSKRIFTGGVWNELLLSKPIGFDRRGKLLRQLRPLRRSRARFPFLSPAVTSSPGTGEVFPQGESQAVNLVAKVLGIMRKLQGVPAPPWGSCRAATEGLLMEKRKKR